MVARKPLPALIWIFAIIGLLVIVIDQVTKTLALQYLEAGGDTIPLLGSWLGLRLIHNPGAAFSIAASHTWIFSVIAVIVVAIICWTGRQMSNRSWIIALGLIAGGAIGNLIDRIIQPPAPLRGHVVDFLNYDDLFVGNVADIAIVIGVLVVVALTALGVPTVKKAAAHA